VFQHIPNAYFFGVIPKTWPVKQKSQFVVVVAAAAAAEKGATLQILCCS